MSKFTNIKNEMAYDAKCDASYNITLEELKNPAPDWEDIIHRTKFTIDPETMKTRTSHEFILDHPDYILVPGMHTYTFKRSQFYEKFKNPGSRIQKDLVNYYKKKDLFVNLYNEGGIWKLRLSWNNTEIKDPNIVVRKVF